MRVNIRSRSGRACTSPSLRIPPFFHLRSTSQPSAVRNLNLRSEFAPPVIAAPSGPCHSRLSKDPRKRQRRWTSTQPRITAVHKNIHRIRLLWCDGKDAYCAPPFRGKGGGSGWYQGVVRATRRYPPAILPSRTGTLHRAFVPWAGTKGAIMYRTGVLPALLAMALSVCVVSSAEARKWRWSFFPGFYVYGHSVRSGDGGRRDLAAPAVETARARIGGGAVGAVIDRLHGACLQQAAELQSWPFERITQVVSPDDAQRSALEALRASTTAAAERLSAECPRSEGAPPWVRFEAVEPAIDMVMSSYAAVEPALRAFYATLDDEQKARLLSDMMLSRSQAREGDRTAERRGRGRRDFRRSPWRRGRLLGNL